MNLTPQKNGTYNSSIEKFFSKCSGKVYAIRFTEISGNQATLKIAVPQNYIQNDQIYLKSLIDERYIGVLSVCYIRIILNNFLHEKGLKNLIIPLVEKV